LEKLADIAVCLMRRLSPLRGGCENSLALASINYSQATPDVCPSFERG
jgi:hypothetical protein